MLVGWNLFPEVEIDLHGPNFDINIDIDPDANI